MTLDAKRLAEEQELDELDVESLPSTKIRICPISIQIPQKGENSNILRNARLKFDEGSIRSLKRNIKHHGLLNAPGVRKVDGINRLIFGERRTRAILWLLSDNEEVLDIRDGAVKPAQEVYGTTKNEGMEVTLYENITDKQEIALRIAENIDTEEVNDEDIILYCLDLDKEEDGDGEKKFSRKEMGKMLKRSQSWLSQSVAIGNLPISVRTMMADHEIRRTAIVDLLRADPDNVDKVIKKCKEKVRGRATRFFEVITNDIEYLEGYVDTLDVAMETAEERGDTSAINRVQKKRDEIETKLNNKKDQKKKKSQISSRDVNSTIDELGVGKGKNRPKTIKTIRESRGELKKKMDEGEIIIIAGAEVSPLHHQILLETLNFCMGEHQSFEELLTAAYEK